MEKKLSIKTIVLLLVISVGLVGLGIGSTYAVFTASAEINNPIVLSSNLSYESGIMDTVTVNVPASGMSTVTLNISNNSGGTLNYVVWYLKADFSNIKTGTVSGSPQSSLNNGGSTTVVVDIRNMSKNDDQVIVGISSGTEIVLSKSMIPVSSSSFTKSSEISYDNSNTGVDCDDVTCMLDELYSIATIQVGDYVYYKPEKASYETDTNYTGYSSSQTIYPEELTLWRVLNKNSDGSVEIISEYVSSSNVNFEGSDAYLSYVGYLNILAKQYETDGITEGSRYFGYNGQTEFIKDTDPTSIFVNPAPFTCSTGSGCNADETKGGGDTLYLDDFNRINTVLGTRVAYKVGSTTKKNYWMASRYYYYSSPTLYRWRGRHLNSSGSASYISFYYYDNGTYKVDPAGYGLRPIVTLKADLEYGGRGTKENPRKIITS